MPIVMLLVIAARGGIVYACFAMGRIPIKLVIGVVIIVIATVVSMIKSIFIRRARAALAWFRGQRQNTPEHQDRDESEHFSHGFFVRI